MRVKIFIFIACCFLAGCSSWMFDDTDGFSAASFEPSSEDDRWWWAPSRKAHLHSRKYQPLLRALANSRQTEDLRLPRNFIPTHYNIILTPIIEPGNFTTLGSIQIDVDCEEAIDQIVLNAADLDIDQFSIRVPYIS